MSKVQVDTIVDKEDKSAPTLSKGAIVTGVCTATSFVGALTGAVTGNADTATTATNAQGLSGTPNITVGNVTSANVTNSKQTTSEHVNVTGVGTFGSDISVADNIVHTGNTNTAIKFASNSITLDSAGSLALHIDGSANIGFGTNSPQKPVDVYGESTGQLRVSNSSKAADLICDSTGGLLRTIGSYPLVLNTNQTDRLRIGTSGQIGLAVASGVSTDYGTSGQVLTSGGSGSAVSWTTPAGGGWVPVANNSVTSGTTLFDNSSCFDSTYDHYRIEFTCHVGDISNETQDYLRFRQYDSGSLRTSSDYDNAVTYSGNGTGTRYYVGTTADHGYLSANQSNQAYQGRIDIWNVHETTVQATFNCWMNAYWIKQPWGPTNYNNMGINGAISACPSDNTPVAVTGIKIYSASAAFSNGNVVVYGLKTS